MLVIGVNKHKTSTELALEKADREIKRLRWVNKKLDRIIEGLEHEKFVKDYNIGYGTVLKAEINHVGCVESVMLVDNTSAGDGYQCLVVDISSTEVLTECSSIEDFVREYKIVDVLGEIADLMVIK